MLDYAKEDITKSEKKYDLVLAINGRHGLTDYKRMLTSNGICVVVGGALSQAIKTMAFGPLLSIGGRKLGLLAAKPNLQDLDFVIKLVEEGRVKPVIDRVYPLQQTAEAMRYVSQGHARGKVLICGPTASKPL